MQKNNALNEEISLFDDNQKANENSQENLPSETTSETASPTEFAGAICPNCGARLEGRKCKLFCPTRGCGYLVTCSEW